MEGREAGRQHNRGQITADVINIVFTNKLSFGAPHYTLMESILYTRYNHRKTH